MNCKYIGIRRALIVIQFIFILLITLSPLSNARAQNKESVAISDLKAGDSIYIITNREIDTTKKELSFHSKVSEESTLTFLKVTLNQSLEMVSHLFSQADFMSEVSVKTSEWLLFIHGDGKTYNESVQRGLDIQNTHNVNVIVFSWPSELPDINGLKNFKNSERNVVKSVDHFKQLLSFMKDFKESNSAYQESANLSMFLHSLGNLHLKKLVDSTNSDRVYDTIFENLIINSAAVNRKNHEEWVEKLDFQKRIYITNNHYDYSLKGLHIYTKHGNQLGEEFSGPSAKNANYVHFTEAVGFRTPTSNTHTYFIGDIPQQSRNIRNFYFDVLHGNKINFSDSSQFVKRNEGVGYDIVF
ncbi:MAG: alpha/beta hydrolase [Brumimicrobium sp.]